MTKREWREFFTGMAFISPWIAGFLIFVLWPVGASIYYSFCDYDVMSKPVWVGALNYRDMMTDEVFWKALRNTFYFAGAALPLGLIIALLVAVLLNQQIRFRSGFRTVYFLPSLIPAVASAMIWLWILNGKFGLLNYGLKFLGIEGPNWLSDELWTKPSIILMSVWGIGGTIVIYLAALQDVPRELYESAEIDGASAWTKLRHITIPMISPVIYFNLIMGIIGCLQIFSQPFILFGGGGTNRSALFYAVYIYQSAFDYNNMGYACAMSWVLFMIILFLTWLATKTTRKHVFYAGE
jgi:multiple sugar transport system permease protein